MANQAVIISVLADTKSFTKDFQNAASVATKAVAAIGVAASAFVVASIKVAGDAQKVATQTAAALQSTGDASGKSAAQIETLSTQLSNLTGVSKDTIQSSENLLLTFSNIRGTTFDQATKSALDMSVALGTDATSAAQQLGKALNAPLTGLTALQREGVTFTATQKAQIANYVKLGETAQAQQIILDQVNEKFGGSAAAAGATFEGSLDRVKAALTNLQVTIGSAFLPVLTQVAGKIADVLGALASSPAFQTVVNDIASFVGSLLSGKSAIGNFAVEAAKLASFFSPFGLVLKVIEPLLPQIASSFETIGKTLLKNLAPVLPTLTSALGTLVKMLSGALAGVLPIIAKLVVTLADVLGKVLGAVLPVVIKVFDVLVKALQPIITSLLPPLAKLFSFVGQVLEEVVVPIFKALSPVILELAKAFAPVLTAVGELVGPLINLLLPILKAIIPPILAVVDPLVKLLAPILVYVADLVGGLAKILADSLGTTLKVIGDLLSGNFVGALHDAQSGASQVFGDITGLFTKMASDGKGIFTGFVNFFVSIWNSLVSTAQAQGKAVANALAGVIDFFVGLELKIRDALAGAIDWLVDIGRNIVTGLLNGLKAEWGSIQSWLSGAFNGLIKWLKGLLGIHSPSTVFAGIGQNIVAGLVSGLSDLSPVTAAMTNLAGAVTGSFTSGIAVATPSVTGSGTATSPVVNINLSGVITDPVATGRAIKSAMDDYFRFGGRS